MQKIFRSNPITGGCECGAVRYEVIAKPLAMFNCHCTVCQHVTGGAYTPVVLVLTKDFKITKGEIRYHLTDSVSGVPHKRGFCATCGARLTGAEKEQPGHWLAVTASSLDDPTIFKPSWDIYTSHAQPWDFMNPALPKYKLGPPK